MTLVSSRRTKGIAPQPQKKTYTFTPSTAQGRDGTCITEDPHHGSRSTPPIPINPARRRSRAPRILSPSSCLPHPQRIAHRNRITPSPNSHRITPRRCGATAIPPSQISIASDKYCSRKAQKICRCTRVQTSYQHRRAKRIETENYRRSSMSDDCNQLPIHQRLCIASRVGSTASTELLSHFIFTPPACTSTFIRFSGYLRYHFRPLSRRWQQRTA